MKFILLSLTLLLSAATYAQSWQIIDDKGKVLRTLQVDSIMQDDAELLRFSKDGKWGFIDYAGNIIVQPRFQKADVFREGLGAVMHREKYGYVNMRGDVQIPIVYQEAHSFSDGFAKVMMNNKLGFIDKQGLNAIGYKYSEISDFKEGRAVTRVGFNKERGLIDKTGKYAIQPCCFDMSPPSEGKVRARVQGRYGYFDVDGNTIIEPKYRAATSFSEGYAFVSDEGGLMKLIDKNGTELTEQIFKKPHPLGFKGGFAAMSNGSRWGFINTKGEQVIDFIYDDVTYFVDGIAAVKKGKYWGYINGAGEEVLPFIYQTKSPFYINRARKIAFVKENSEAKAAIEKAKQEKERAAQLAIEEEKQKAAEAAKEAREAVEAAAEVESAVEAVQNAVKATPENEGSSNLSTAIQYITKYKTDIYSLIKNAKTTNTVNTDNSVKSLDIFTTNYKAYKRATDGCDIPSTSFEAIDEYISQVEDRLYSISKLEDKKISSEEFEKIRRSALMMTSDIYEIETYLEDILELEYKCLR